MLRQDDNDSKELLKAKVKAAILFWSHIKGKARIKQQKQRRKKLNIYAGGEKNNDKIRKE